MNCSNGHRMFNYDDVNFECKHPGCTELMYRQDADRIRHLTTPQVLGGMGRPTCPVCGKVSIPNNGGYACIHCSGYYELPDAERPPRTLYLMPRRSEGIPGYWSVAMILLTGNLIVIMAVAFGG